MELLLKKWRKKRKMSLRQLEEITGIGRSTLSNYENGVTSPPIDQLEILAMALECHITDLLDSPYL